MGVIGGAPGGAGSVGDVAVQQGIHTEYPNKGQGLPQTMLSASSDFPSGMVLGLLVGAAVGGGLIFVALGYIFIRKCFCRRKTIDIDESSVLNSQSAPTTRNSSPHHTKKFTHERRRSSSCSQAQLVRSVTADMIPDFILPPERVQPKDPVDRRFSETGLQFTYGMLGSVQPDLYRSLDDESEELPPSVHGRLWFSVVYDAAVQQLTVALIKAKGLKGREKTNAPRDPFAKIYLLPDERTCQESRVRKRTLAPKFNESFAFEVSEFDVSSRTLRFSIYDVDKRRVRHSLGHVIVPLSDVDLTRADVMWKDLESFSQTPFCLGDIQLSVTYTPVAEKIKVAIHGCRNLRKLDYGAEDGVYAKVSLMHGQRVYKSKRTESQGGTCDLTYNESFTFTLPPKQLDTCSLVVAIMSTGQGRAGSGHDTEYGRVRIGPFLYARGEELVHWQEMVAHPRTAVTKWHMLSVLPPNTE